jgi:hypothetical protein
VVVLTLRWVLDRENAQKREVLARNEHRPIHEEPYKGDHDVRWIFQT